MEMISNFVIWKGPTLSAKITGMLRDTMRKEDESYNSNFTALSKEKKNEIEFHATVITQGSWPPFAHAPTTLIPQEMQQCTALFDTCYKDLAGNASRKLNWVFAVGTVIVRGTFPSPSKAWFDFSLSPYPR